MYVSKETILDTLPPYTQPWVLVKETQTVPDIISLIGKQHKEYEADYDLIGPYFVGSDVEQTCENLYAFCKDNLKYTEEPEKFQSVGNPASILERGDTGIDCKSYALFIGGCLGAINRAGLQKINWVYRFASYDITKETPYHVFICVRLQDGTDFYVDPTPGSADMEPVYMHDKKIGRKGSLGSLLSDGYTVGALSAPDPTWGTLMPPPAWYPANLPRFYNNGHGFYLRPLNAVPNYTANDVLDCCLYLQTLLAYNRADWQSDSITTAAWKYTNGTASAEMWVCSALQKDVNGDGSGNFAAVSANGRTTDGNFYAQLQARYILNEATTKPWLSAMQAVGGGIDLMTIPMGNDMELPRPFNYPAYLPSLFIAAGNPGQYPAGHLDTKPKIRNGKSSGFTDYVMQPADVANVMLYAQPYINAGPTPYPTNFYINDEVNGAMAFRFKISLQVDTGFTNAQEQAWGITGNLMIAPVLDANPYASGFTLTLQSIVSAAISYFAGKIPGGQKLVTAANYAGSLSGGELITGGPVPAGVFSAEVFQAAITIAAANEKTQSNRKILLIALLAGGVLAWYYWDDLKKMF